MFGGFHSFVLAHVGREANKLSHLCPVELVILEEDNCGLILFLASHFLLGERL